MARRTDVHSDANIVPMDYEYVLWYDVGGANEPSLNVNCERPFFDMATLKVIPGYPHRDDGRCCLFGLRQIAKVKFVGVHGGGGQCDVCGANFRYGDVWRHKPTEGHIHVGHECADKYSMIANRKDLKAYRKAVHEARSIAVKEQKRATARDEFIKEHDLVKAFELRSFEPPKEPGFNPAWILHDMYSKLHQYGSLSEKQIVFARKLADQILNPPSPKPEEKHVPAPVGRVAVKGKVVSVKHYDGDYGPSTKMTVKVETPDGSWLVWTTVPAAITETFLANPHGAEDGIAPWLKGKEVEFTATLTRGNDEHFAFGKRPSKARVVA